NDFMVAETKEVKTTEGGEEKTVSQPTGKEAVKIPSFLDMELAFNARKVYYDNLELDNAKGVLVIRDETASLKNISTNIFNGSIGLDGMVSTKNQTPTFEMKLDLNALDIASSFNGMEMLQGMAPIAKALQGKLQSTLNLKGNLNEDLTPQLASLAGNALAQLLTADIDVSKSPLLANLDSKLNFINLNDIDLNNLKTQLTFENGKVNIAPFDFNIKDINIQIGGSHGFDNTMNYNLNLDVPAKYLGSQVGGTLSKLSGSDLQQMEVELPIGLTGTFQNPQINLNMQQAVNSLTQKIVAQQKEELKEKGKDALGNIISGAINKQTQNKSGDTTTVKQDSTGTQPNSTTKRDSINRSQQEQVQNAAKNILGGILKNSKKKTDTTKNNQ
ncbi:MAG: AsmA-like C-terminal region-containing protein, partial [Bacteroidota bacterium]|nr:AsmA-like C-terminal region-containing protein [Bacteroidota bacterium]